MTAVQKEKLIDYVTSNHGTLFGKGPSEVSERTKDEVWNMLAVELNEMGAVKDVRGWKRCYAGIKSSTNKKMKNSSSETSSRLNSYETKIITANQSVPSKILKTVDLQSNVPQNDQNQVAKTSNIKSTPLQRQRLAALVGENYDALFGRLSNSSNGGEIKNKVWKLIADQLNLIGPKKDSQGWMRCFTSLKASTKQKLSVIRQNKNRNGIGKKAELDEIQSEVFKMHHPGTLDGCPTIDELGFGKHTAGLKVWNLEEDTVTVELFPSQQTPQQTYSDIAEVMDMDDLARELFPSQQTHSDIVEGMDVDDEERIVSKQLFKQSNHYRCYINQL